MEEEEDKVDPDYLKGFNEGYLLAQYNPELAETLATIDSELSRIVGFKAGREQFHAEQILIQQNEVGQFDQQRSQEQTDLFDQLYQQQNDLNKKLSPSEPTPSSKEEDDLFAQLKKKQEQGHKGHDIDP